MNQVHFIAGAGLQHGSIHFIFGATNSPLALPYVLNFWTFKAAFIDFFFFGRLGAVKQTEKRKMTLLTCAHRVTYLHSEHKATLALIWIHV